MTNSIPEGHQRSWPQSLPDCKRPCALMVWRDFVRRWKDEFLFSEVKKLYIDKNSILMKKPKFNTSEILIFTCIIVAVIVLPLLIPQMVKFLGSGEQAGTFGDQYGALNTLFSGLAFFVIFLSLKTQRKELQLQRDEMAMARGEHERQNFEAQFMFLLKNLSEQLATVKGDFLSEDGNVCHYEGHEYFAHIFNDMHNLHNGLVLFSPNIELFNMYNIDPEKGEYKEQYANNYLKDFSFKLVVSIEAKRRKDYFNLIQTFNLILEILRDQFAYQLRQANGNIDRVTEVERHFEVYTGLIRSTMSLMNLTYFLYVQKRYKDGFKKDFITDSLFYKIAEVDYLNWNHYLQLGYNEVAKSKEAAKAYR